MQTTEASLADLMSAYRPIRPADIATLRTIFKNVVLPFLGGGVAPLDDRLEDVPAHALYRVLSTDGLTWNAYLQAALPPGSSYQKAYCRFIRRLIVFGETTGQLHPDQYLMSPAWRDLTSAVARCTSTMPPARRSALRCAFKRLAYWATANEVAPEEVPIEQPGERSMEAFFQTFAPDRDGDFYRARIAWNTAVTAQPTRGLRGWSGGRHGTIAAMPKSAWPPVVRDGLEAIFARDGLGSWRDETRRGYIQRLGSYLGVLTAIGVDVAGLFEGVVDPVDAIRILFQGMPAGTLQLGAVHLAGRLIAEPNFKMEMLSAMRVIAGRYDGRASERNPFVSEAVAELVEAKKVTSAMNLVIKAIAINRGLLEVDDRHITWLTRRRSLLVQVAKKHPSAYAAKKRVIFRHPYLWEELVNARKRLRSHSAALETAWREAAGDRVCALQRRWAVALRNEVLIGLMLCYPLRVNNLVGMRLGVHYDPRVHHILFEAAETKNEREVDYELPEGGSLGDLRGLVDQYLAEARPALLAGRRSDHFFVPDPRGGVRLRDKGVNAILTDISRRFFADLLPEGVAVLNPHLLRHTTASYQLAVRQDLNLAAQLLNDSPATITQAYADVLACKKEATKRFLSNFTVSSAGLPRTDSKRR